MTKSTTVLTPFIEHGKYHVSTLDLYKFLGYRKHQTLTDKIKKIQLGISPDEEVKNAIRVDKLHLLLHATGHTSELTRERMEQLKKNLESLKKGHSYPSSSDEGMSYLEYANTQSNLNKTGGVTQKVPIAKGKDTRNSSNITRKKEEVLPKSDEGLTDVLPDLDKELTEIRETVTQIVRKFSIGILTIIYCFVMPIALILRELAKAFQTREFVFLVLMGGLYVQVTHNATLFASVSEQENNTIKWVLAYLFGTVAEMTALLLTIHRADKKTIFWFSVFTFLVNLLYYRVWEDFNYVEDGFNNKTLVVDYASICVKIVQSAFLAFVIYSYSKIFTTESVRNSE